MPTIDAVLERSARIAPDNVAVIEWESGRRVTYRQLDTWVSAFAGFLHAAGLGRGETVAIYLPNTAKFLTAQFGAARAGCVPAYVNARLSAGEAAGQMRIATARAVVTTAASAEELRGLPGVPEIVIIADGRGPGASLDDILARGGGPGHSPFGSEDTDAIIRFTSGSTGAPKGLVVTHRAWLIRASALLAEEIKVETGSTTMVLGPLSHQAGLFVLPTLMRQGAILMFEKFTIGKVVDAVRAEPIARSQMVPTMLKIFLGDAAARAAFAAWNPRQIIYGGSPVEATAIADLLELMPNTDLMQAYGSHEAGSISHLDGAGHRDPRLRRSAGEPFLSAEVRIRDIPGSDIGEIEVKAPWFPHLRLTEAGSQPITEEWIATGDLGVIEDGYLFLKDRANDVIISGGFNVYPMEVEQVLNTHPGIVTSAVVSEPDNKWGERVVAYIVPRPGSTQEELAAVLDAHCRSRLANYKVPKAFHPIDVIPVNPNGKPDRRSLSASHWAGYDRRIN
ncbi:MAG: long-chain fatty acid--CoA ligase [Salinarimonadaceae bacterium]|nr:MAG: long-chain fatty acid--CoA ligase [Salinarimonadaceae bacterium]